jgi:hypothetical protein
MGNSSFVPEDFEPPAGLRTDAFVLEPLGPEHNERDHAAWMSSIEHIHATPGFDDPNAPDPWPVPMTLDENLRDLEMHASHFRDRLGFTYSVVDPTDADVLGCVYIYPPSDPAFDAGVESWVRVSHADLDTPLWQAVSGWLATDSWPFRRVRYSPRRSADEQR